MLRKEMRRKVNYILGLIISVIVLNACNAPIDPVDSSPKIKTESKYQVDITTLQKKALIYKKEFDFNGNLTRYCEFWSSGVQKALSEFTYKNNESIEQKTEFDNKGEVTKKTSVKYIFNDNGLISQKSCFDDKGKELQKETYLYDSKGNISKRTELNISNGITTNFDFKNQYNNDGKLVGRSVTKSSIGSNAVVDSMAYSTTNNQINIISYDGFGKVNNVFSIFYTKNGLPEIETESNAFGVILQKFKYFYEFY